MNRLLVVGIVFGGIVAGVFLIGFGLGGDVLELNKNVVINRI